MIAKKELVEILLRLQLKMPNGAPKFEIKDVLEAWTDSLIHLEKDALIFACKQAVATFDFHPSIAKLCELAKDFKTLPSSQKALPGNVEDGITKLLEQNDLWGVGGTALRVELPEPQCFEKQYLEERITFLTNKLTDAGIRVYRIDRSQGVMSTEGGRAEIKTRYVATIWMAREGYTPNFTAL